MDFRTRKVVKPGDLNPMNALFGGRLLEWVDEECFIYCGCQLKHTRLVTKFISEINFASPAHYLATTTLQFRLSSRHLNKISSYC